MRVAELAFFYVLIGAGCALVVVVREGRATRIVDAILLFTLWPLCGPFLLLRSTEKPIATLEALVALRRAGGSPLAGLLPDEQQTATLSRRLDEAERRIREIDALLTRPEFSERAVESRIEELRRRDASSTALATAAMRLQNVRRLRSLRERSSRELDEVRELLAQIVTQAEVVRLAGAPEDSVEGMVRELLLRVDGLDEILERA